MDIHERLKYLRKQLNLTTRAFGESIHMSGGAITNMEKGLRNVTDRTVQDICRVYMVNPEWLLHGTEPIFQNSDEWPAIDAEVLQLVRQYSRLSCRDQELIKNIIDSLSEKVELQNSF